MGFVIDVARLGNKYLTDNEPWKKFKDDPEYVSRLCLILFKSFLNRNFM